MREIWSGNPPAPADFCIQPAARYTPARAVDFFHAPYPRVDRKAQGKREDLIKGNKSEGEECLVVQKNRVLVQMGITVCRRQRRQKEILRSHGRSPNGITLRVQRAIQRVRSFLLKNSSCDPSADLILTTNRAFCCSSGKHVVINYVMQRLPANSHRF